MKTIKDFLKLEGWFSSLTKATLAIIIVAGLATVYSCEKEYETCPTFNSQTNQSGGSTASAAIQTVSLNSRGIISVSGALSKTGVTTYQYGTHLVTALGENARYALRSSTVNLCKFENKNVEVNGYAILGYPVNGGPVYLEVIGIRELNGTPSVPIIETGTLKTDVYTNLYATYALIVPGKYYVLTSANLDLNLFINKKVEIRAYIMSTDVADGGRIHLNVVTIKAVEDPELISASGMLVEVGSGTYQYLYGWRYMLKDPGTPTTYFLKSSVINLDRYAHGSVKLTGHAESFVPVNSPAKGSFNNFYENTMYLNVNWIMEIAVMGENPSTK